MRDLSTCPRCSGQMIKSVGLLDNIGHMGIPDFPGNTVDSVGQTVTYRSNGKLYKCLKCEDCGHSRLCRHTEEK